ncbi:response regulator [Magnetospira sp. QH-2]|uniref:response regulator n=1 Tax=Magnetospira sp. (strain QH-2) TaxID=1288970 RepID=UPI0003E81538|nr:response regulator [Magnetospira sp. QH-2]CCQ73654.1 protein of unknown function [Magnetospira sp. QH-2]
MKRLLAQGNAVSEELFIVVVDDDEVVADALGTILECWGHRVAVSNGDTDFDPLIEQDSAKPDLIIADYNLGNGRTGVDLITRLRQHHGNPIAATLLTGDTASLPPVDPTILILLKPVEPATLKEVLGSLRP